MGISGKHRTRPQPKYATKPRDAAAVHAVAIRQPLPPKLTPPNPTRLYPRERLFDLLDRTRKNHRIIWVSAPGGAGKTSLAVSYLSERKLPVLWYQVDAGDGDVASFFYYIGLAARRTAPRYKKPLPVLSREYLADIPTFTRNFFREFYRRMPRNGAFVLDNYQDAPEDSLLHDVLHTAMSEVPESINLIVLSRVEPPAVLARLRLCDHAACLDWNKMQLTLDETVGISAVRSSEAVPDRKMMETLHERTQGWAAGVVLLLEQSKRGASLDANHAPTDQALLFDYFANEFLARAEPTEQEFLLKTALFPKITVNAAKELTGIANAQAILDDLTRRNYFTVRHVRSDGDFYEYHPLFRKFLSKELESRDCAATVNSLRKQAAALLDAQGDLESATLLSLQAQDWASAVRLIVAQATALATAGRYLTLRHWLDGLPALVINDSPWLLFWSGAARQPFDLEVGRELYAQAYRLFKARGDVLGSYLSWSAAVDSFSYAWGDFHPLDFWIAELDELRQRFPQFPSLDVEARVTCGMLSALMWRNPLHPAMQLWRSRAEEMLDREADPFCRLMIASHLVTYYIWWRGDRRVAPGLLAAAGPLLRKIPGAPPLTQLLWQVMNGIFATGMNAPETCIQACEEGLGIAARTGIHHLDPQLLFQGVNGFLIGDNLEGAQRYLNLIPRHISPHAHLNRALYHYLSVWLAICRGDLVTAREHAIPMLHQSELSGARNAQQFAIYTDAVRLTLEGEYREAERLLDELLVWCAQANATALHFYCRLTLAFIYICCDDKSKAKVIMESALLVAKKLSYNVHSWIGWRRDIMSTIWCFALDNHIEIDWVCALIKRVKLLPPLNQPVPEAWPFPLKLHTLGHFSVLVNDEPLKFVGKSQKKPLELLKVLVALGGHEVSEAKLAEALWPDVDGDTASQSLATTLHRLRKLIGEETIARQEGRLSLDSRHAWVDAWAFERNLSELEQACQKNDVDKLQSLTTRLFTLYRGPFLKDEPEVPWVLVLREKLRGKFLRHLETSARCLAPSQPEQAMTCYEKALEIEPLAESLYRGLMQVHLNRGRRAEALTVYERCKKILNAQLGICPSPDTEDLARKARAN